jgi:hypothetical protein
METPEFKRLLFKSAIFVKSNDGRVHEDSVREIQSYAKIASYFKDIESDELLKEITRDLQENKEHAIEQYFKELGEANLSLIQELLILEIIMRIIHGAETPDQHEIEFLQVVRTRLKVYNEIILERFGEIDYLVSEQYTDIKEAEEGSLIDEILSPDLNKFNDLDLNDSKM